MIRPFRFLLLTLAFGAMACATPARPARAPAAEAFCDEEPLCGVGGEASPEELVVFVPPAVPSVTSTR